MKLLGLWSYTKLMSSHALLDFFSRRNAHFEDEAPLRAELFGVVQMEAYGKLLAGLHKPCQHHVRDVLLSRLSANEKILDEARVTLTRAVKEGRQITPAADWLLDNFFLIQEQIRTAKRHLPSGYSKELPRLLVGAVTQPRVYDLALKVIAHGDGRVESESLARFVSSYQQVTDLTLGELWAIPIMLRLALIENLRRIAVRLIGERQHCDLADSWAERMVAVVEQDPGNLILTVADMARSDPPMVPAFVAELTRKMQGLGAAMVLPMTWITPRLAESGTTLEQMIQLESQQQAGAQVSISNSIYSLRLLGKMDWRDFVESLSAVETILQRDPLERYALMDFATRDSYRHAVEKVGRSSDFSESEIARRALQLATRASLKNPLDPRETHIGFYLVDQGLQQLEIACAVRVSPLARLKRLFAAAPVATYASTILGMTLLLSLGLLAKSWDDQSPIWQLPIVGLFSLLATSQLAVGLVNWFVTVFAVPSKLPRMDYSHGIAPNCETMVVVPTMLINAGMIRDLCEDLEVKFLANRDDRIRFCLLTDFIDAQYESTPSDELLLNLVKSSIEQLNEKYPDLNGERFLLLHRPRVWNARENSWMGHERKRGKLSALNGFLRHGSSSAFSCVVGDATRVANIKYVITLDTDTQLPRDAARAMVATISHPLNQARLRADMQRVDLGYGILQPRISCGLPSIRASSYQRLYSSDSGIDPYTRASSDVYQDLFGEGSFIGKGIYEVDIFQSVFEGRIPVNRILSHDLLEGCYARSGLISDVDLIEDAPARYLNDVKRRHRWIRGDWQLLSWVTSHPPTSYRADNGDTMSLQRIDSVGKPLSALSRWKIVDNLRRSLVSTSFGALLVYGWVASPSPWFWCGVVTGILTIPCLIASLRELFRKDSEVLAWQHLSALARSTFDQLSLALLTLIFLPFDMFFSLDAIARALWRMVISRKKLLEWVPSQQTDQVRTDTLKHTYQVMWFEPAVALELMIALLLMRPHAFFMALPLLFIWLTAPAIAWFISQERASSEIKLDAAEEGFLRSLSRKIWSFYEELVTAEDNWLPPDNIQEQPSFAIAHRTSPTNIGLALLANLAAHDFAYISTSTLLGRCAKTLHTMSMMERYRGHFYNWYDTQSLKPLLPTYISTVDNGNLVAHLMTLRSGLLELIDQPFLSRRMLAGVTDTFQVVQELAQQGFGSECESFQRVVHELELKNFSSIEHYQIQVHVLLRESKALGLALKDAADSQLIWWVSALQGHCTSLVDEFALMLPWCVQSPDAADKDDGTFGFDLAIKADSSLHDIGNLESRWRDYQRGCPVMVDGQESVDRRVEFGKLLVLASQRAQAQIRKIEDLCEMTVTFSSVDFTFLYDKASHLLSIGYNVADQRCDAGSYDLLASEARLCTYILIAEGQIPQESWFALGRPLTLASGNPILLSWSGSMFEYLMPLLVMPTFDNTLLDRTYHAVVQRQITYGEQRKVPWGISESGYNSVDASLNYQYRAFGVPGIGFKRGLAEDLVIAPYASVLALLVNPKAACDNLQRLVRDGCEGKYGLYEAIDFTSSRVPRGQTQVLIRSFMAHHQGMSLLALCYHLLDRPMQRRFAADPLLHATLLLLQEKSPKAPTFHVNPDEHDEFRSKVEEQTMPLRVFDMPDTRVPEIQLLSNGSYHLMITNAGGNWSRWRDLSLTRWREDATRDNWGSFCYVRDCASGKFWSTTYQPTLVKPEYFEAIFSEGRAEFRRQDHQIELHSEIVVSPEDDIELRRTHISNRSNVARTIEITTFAEIVLANADAEAAHPAFSNLFVQTEILTEQIAVLATRRPWSKGDKTPWMFSQLVVHGEPVTNLSFETDREKFLGRGRTSYAPEALSQVTDLSNTQGSVLDPIAAIRVRIHLQAQQTMVFDHVIGVAETRDTVMHLIAKYQDRHLADRVFELAWTHSQVILRQLNVTETDAQLYARLAGSVLCTNERMRADVGILIKNRRGQSGLWSYAISGDLPIVLVQVTSQDNIELVRQLVQAHAYWRLKGLSADLVIWNEDHAGYRQLLQEQILGLISSGVESSTVDRPGGIYVRQADQMPLEDRILLQAVARIVLVGSKGTLIDQLNRRWPLSPVPLQLVPRQPRSLNWASSKHQSETEALAATIKSLQFFNGTGGFSSDGREYVVVLRPECATPAPWVNVLANNRFGTVISESGQAYSWGENAHEFRLTPWSNDPVTDASGEAFYVRDEDSGHYWSPTALPRRGDGVYVTRHGQGYSVFEHTEDGIRSELSVYVATEASIKYSVLKIVNMTTQTRRISVTGYVEWVLGSQRSKSAAHIVTESETGSGAIFAHNSYNTDFCDLIGFFAVDANHCSVSGDRVEFLGRNGSLQQPAAMKRSSLSGRVGAGLDPCAAIQVAFELVAGQEHEIVFMLGVAGRRSADVSSIIQRYRGAMAARVALEQVRTFWQRLLGTIQVDTPNKALNVMANGWLIYQVVAARIWARSGFYQSGGAFGFRDQLQDVMATLHARPQLARDQILLSASRQFVEGDVQHWWHPPSGRGVRTKCSDDYLWLPYVVHCYVQSTGDTGILDEKIAFLEGRLLTSEEESYYDLPVQSSISENLYQHCVRAIAHGLRFGVHGLPLIGSCDWNDGFDKIGPEGKGESIWLAFFLYEILRDFSGIALMREDRAFAQRCKLEADGLKLHIDKNGWDGNWYRRAYFDDGTPLGSEQNEECKIDSISQSWSVLSGVADNLRAHTAMHALDEHLVRRTDRLVQLLEPPFDKSSLNPGYIKGYVPGVRENGGQYTHAAVWAAMAFAKLGDHQRAWELADMINPIAHSTTPADVAVYRVEPYVLAADVYAASPHIGRGGWTWYTGSAGWMYRLLVESLLGVQRRANTLVFKPCLPAEWGIYNMTYTHLSTRYLICVHRTAGMGEEICVTLDGILLSDGVIQLEDNGTDHVVDVIVI